jgi:peptide/nickel transport system substrate-binding protein
MLTRRSVLGVLASSVLPVQYQAEDVEPPYFRPLLDSGELAPLAERLPKVPRIVNLASVNRVPGRHGGDARMLISGQKDIRLMTIYGYARLVGFDDKLNLHADILESYESVDDRVFTFRIREGHKWSDGSPLTAEDFRYSWEDVHLNRDLSLGGITPYLLSGGKPPIFEVLDPYTVRYTWEIPNPDFLPRLAAAQPLSMVMPSAYLKQFHSKYQDEEKLKALVKKYKVKQWPSLHMRMSRQYRPENPDLPTLDPWRNTTQPPAEQFVFERNAYFHRVDENGRQLPYIDRFILNSSSSSIIPAKTGAGETELQGTALDFSDYTFLKDAEKRYPIKVSLWKRTQGSRVALLPNLNCADAVWRKLLHDARFRRALSLAIDRREINMALFFGLAKESADTVLPESPLFEPRFAAAWTNHDPVLAAKLLDEAGLTERDDDGFRLLQDGRRAQIVIETSGESTLESDVLELVTDYWAKVGIGLFIRASQRDVFRMRAVGGETIMAIWSGIDNGIPTADMNPGELAPTADYQLQWPVWGMYYQTHGEKGSAPDLKEAKELVELYDSWRVSRSGAERRGIWSRMLASYADNVFSIGLVNATLQPVVSSTRLRNLPENGLYGFEPTSYFGVYMPDAFWFDGEA